MADCVEFQIAEYFLNPCASKGVVVAGDRLFSVDVFHWILCYQTIDLDSNDVNLII